MIWKNCTMRITAIHYLFTLTLSLLYPLLAADRAPSIEELKQQIIKHHKDIVSLSNTLSYLQKLESNPPSIGVERPDNLAGLICETAEDLMAENTILEELLTVYHTTAGYPFSYVFNRTFTQRITPTTRTLASLLKEANQNSLLPVEFANSDDENPCKLKFARPTHTPRAETPPKPSYMKTNTPETASTLKAPDVQNTPGEPQTKEVEKKLKRTKSIRSMDELRLPPPLDGLQERDSSAF